MGKSNFPNGFCFYFLVGSVLGFMALLWTSGVGKSWENFAVGPLSFLHHVNAHHMFVLLPLLFLVLHVRYLARRCDAVEGFLLQLGKFPANCGHRLCVCALCGSEVESWNTHLEPVVDGVSSQHFQNGSRVKKATVTTGRGLAAAAAEEEEESDVEDEKDIDNLDDEDEEFNEVDVMALRRRVEKERKLKEAALEELEKERRAAASAADEAMAKILCLQYDKGSSEREAKKFREIAEQKQLHDRQTIENLQFLVSEDVIEPLQFIASRMMRSGGEEDEGIRERG